MNFNWESSQSRNESSGQYMRVAGWTSIQTRDLQEDFGGIRMKALVCMLVLGIVCGLPAIVRAETPVNVNGSVTVNLSVASYASVEITDGTYTASYDANVSTTATSNDIPVTVSSNHGVTVSADLTLHGDLDGKVTPTVHLPTAISNFVGHGIATGNVKVQFEDVHLTVNPSSYANTLTITLSASL